MNEDPGVLELNNTKCIKKMLVLVYINKNQNKMIFFSSQRGLVEKFQLSSQRVLGSIPTKWTFFYFNNSLFLANKKF